MQVNTASSQNSNSSSSSSTKSSGSGSSLDYNSFLKLFMAEMKNQDPTAPTSSTEYIAQFATFSQVEQSMQSNTKLDSMLSSLALSQANGVIGRTLTSEDGSISGKVTAVRIVNGGALADLDSGKSVVLGPGVVVT
ncbi:MAG: flgD [Proteobacteria bacterium]|nr:flgD [Pseudomonadota bacterium]